MTSDLYFFSWEKKKDCFLPESENGRQAHNSNAVQKSAVVADCKGGPELHEKLKC